MAKKKEVLIPEEDEIKTPDNEGILDPELDAALPPSLDADLDIPVTAEDMTDMDAEDDAHQDEVEEVEVETKPNGRGVSRNRAETPVEENGNPQPALSSTSRRSSSEMQRSQKDREAARQQRQEEAFTVGRYLAAEKRNNVLTGRIAGVEARGEHVFWMIFDGPVIVYIPFHEALPFLPESVFAKDTPRERMLKMKRMLTKSIGATVPFSVEEVEPDGDNYLVFGSRREALKRISRRYFGHNAANPVKIGDDLVGNFLAVGPHAAWVNVNGVDVRMIPEQLTHRYIEDMRTVYNPGDEIDLRLQRLEMQDGKPVMALSGRPCEVEAGKRRHNRISHGGRFVATVTSHRVVTSTNTRTNREERYHIAQLWLEDVDLPAYATLASPKERKVFFSGDRVVVEVDKIAQTGYVRCRILKKEG